MDTDLMNLAADAAQERADSRLNTWVAITIALLSTFMAICKVKDDNVVQAMQQAQADKIDHWSYYQARRLREDLATANAETFKLLAGGADAHTAETLQAASTHYATIAAQQNAKRLDIEKQAESDQQRYDALNVHDDQFDLADALSSLAVAMLAMCTLTHKRWLFAFALLPTGGGVLMGLSGLAGWSLHSAWLAALLSGARYSR